MQPGLKQTRSEVDAYQVGHRLEQLRDDERGFTIVEMMIAMTLLAVSLVALAHLMFGAMSALNATRQRTVFVELATAQMEIVRALPYDEVCVTSAAVTASGIYESGNTFEGRPAAVDTGCAVEPVTTLAATDRATAHTVRRWVTYTDTAGGGGSSAERFKRLTVEVDWTENEKFPRTLRLTSVLYPGGRGDAAVGNAPPVAVAASTPSGQALAGTTVNFSGAGSSDPDGDLLVYQWDFGDGSPAASGQTVAHVFAAPGSYTVQLSVSDPSGATNYAVLGMNIGSSTGNFPPVADLVATSPTEGVAPLTVTVDASGSYDPDPGDSIIGHQIDWGDGSSPTTGVLSASHQYGSAGSFTILLTVTDTGGLTDTASLVVTTTPLNCSVAEGFFRNPSTNAAANDVTVTASDRAVSPSFTFRATTNSACSGLTASLPHASGNLEVAMVLQADSAGVRSWAGSASFSGKLNLGTGQVGVFRATDASGGPAVLRSFTFTVHR